MIVPYGNEDAIDRESIDHLRIDSLVESPAGQDPQAVDYAALGAKYGAKFENSILSRWTSFRENAQRRIRTLTLIVLSLALCF